MNPRLLSLLLLLAASCAAPPGLRREPTGDLQPLDPGLAWTYDVDGTVQTRSVVGVEPVGRFECRILETRTGDTVERAWMRWDRDGLKVHRIASGDRNVDFEDPVLLIHRLAVPGAAWSFEETHGPLTLSVSARHEGEDEIDVAGRFRRCARIRLVKRAAGRVVLDQTCWYAPDIGLARMTVVAAGEKGASRATLRLTAFNFHVD